MDWYLSITLEFKRDVIEPDIQDDLDLSGWDLRKALILFRKSNPPLAEWLVSPIVYIENTKTPETLRRLLPDYYNDMIIRKQAGDELDREPRVPVISDFIDSEMDRLSDGRFEFEPKKGDVEKLNMVFRNALDEAWG
jgi:predicted nucleotidyltransferase